MIFGFMQSITRNVTTLHISALMERPRPSLVASRVATVRLFIFECRAPLRDLNHDRHLVHEVGLRTIAPKVIGLEDPM